MSDHPFAQYLRILGKGPKSRRSLTQEEASDALKMILAGEVTEKQLGAFLLLMRANGESEDELKGFIKGLRDYFSLDSLQSNIDLDWAAYAGKWRYPPYFLLSIKLLVAQGYRILLHGDAGQFDNRSYAESYLTHLNFKQATSLSEAQEWVGQNQPVYLALEKFAMPLRDILHLKSEIGVRTVFNTAVKLLNPLNANKSMQGIYHKGVEHLHHAAASVNGVRYNLVFKGEGGEPEIRPDALNQLYFSEYLSENVAEGDSEEGSEEGSEDVSTQNHAFEQYPFKAITDRHRRPKTWQESDLFDLWQGQTEEAYGENAVIATATVALMLLEDLSSEQALQKAKGFWQARDKQDLSLGAE